MKYETKPSASNDTQTHRHGTMRMLGLFNDVVAIGDGGGGDWQAGRRSATIGKNRWNIRSELESPPATHPQRIWHGDGRMVT